MIKLIQILSYIPFSFLYLLSSGIGLLLYHVIRYRRKIVRNNLITSFPLLGLKDIKKIEKGYYQFMSDMMIETIKLLSINDSDLKRRVKVVNPEIINEVLLQGQSAAILLGHYGNWEYVQEIGTYFIKDSFRGSIYHELNESFADRLYKKIRGRWNMHIVPMSKAVRTLLDKDNQPWAFGFIADQRPRHYSKDNWTSFLNHDTAFITGPEDIGKKVGAAFFYLDMERPKRGYYVLEFKRLVPEVTECKYPYIIQYWKEFEKTIMRNPALWLWSHKRWNQKPHP